MSNLPSGYREPPSFEDYIETYEKRLQEAEDLLLVALYHHQGSASKVGQPIRKFLGMSQFEPMTKTQIATAEYILEEVPFEDLI